MPPPSRLYGYLQLEDLLTADFLREPKAILVEAGNGTGKTYRAAEFSAIMQRKNSFERILILESSQETVSNMVDKIIQHGGKAIRYIGVEKVCFNRRLLRKTCSLGITPSLACSFCPFFSRKYKYAYRVFEDWMKDPRVRLVEPRIVFKSLEEGSKVCIQPLLRAYVLEPTQFRDFDRQLQYTPIVVAPSQIVLNHRILSRWYRYRRRQRKERRLLMIIDEADTVFYNSLQVTLEELSMSRRDLDILAMFSPKSLKLSKAYTLYNNIYRIIYRLATSNTLIQDKHVKELEELLSKAERYVASFNRRAKEIAKYIVENNIETNIFKLFETLESLLHISSLKYTLRTAEILDNGALSLTDYDYATRLFFDTTHPWKYFWKIILSATMPTEAIGFSRYVSFETKLRLVTVKRRYKKYRNVYVTFYDLFDDTGGRVSRNDQIEMRSLKLLRKVLEVRRLYVERFREEPSGFLLVFGNSHQLETFLARTEKILKQPPTRKGLILVKTRVGPLALTYAGAAQARGVDILRDFDVSMIVGPLLRPPRKGDYLDPIDFAKGVAEALQAAMRIVRSPWPEKPKLIAIERTMTKPWYVQFYPTWFRELVKENYLEAGQGS